jgi:hypothetical protein
LRAYVAREQRLIVEADEKQWPRSAGNQRRGAARTADE